MSVNQIRPVLDEVAQERLRQVDKWGEQDHPDGTELRYERERDAAQGICDQRFTDGEGSWLDILREEFYEAAAERDPARLRTELIQVAAVATAWVEAIDRRGVGND